MGRCIGSKPDGTPCERIVGASQEHCYAHDPARAEERKRNAARAGKATPNREVRELKDRLAALYDDVLSGRVDRGDAAVCNQIINTRLRALALERDIRETEELAGRISALEQAAEGVEVASSSWG